MLMKYKWNQFFSFVLFFLFNFFVMRSRLSHLRLYQHIQRRDEIMFFFCNRCSRDFFKICKKNFDVDICDEYIKLKNLVMFLFLKLFVNFVLSCVCVIFTFLKKTFWKWKNQISCRNWKYFCRIFFWESRNSIVVFSSKKNRDDLFAREFNFRRLLIKQRRFVQCFKNFKKKKKTILSCKSNVCFLVSTRSMILLSFILSKCINQSLKRLSLS